MNFALSLGSILIDGNMGTKSKLSSCNVVCPTNPDIIITCFFIEKVGQPCTKRFL